MASGSTGDFIDDLDWRGCRWTENSKVYTRRHKKVQKICKNDDAATTATSAAEKRTSAPPTASPKLTSKRTELSSATLATTASEDAKNDGAASPPPTPPGNLARTTTPERFEGNKIVEESREAVGAKDVDSDRLQEVPAHQEQSISRPPKDADSSVLQREIQSSTAEDYHSTENQVREGSGIQTDDLLLPDSYEAQNLGVSSGRNVISAKPGETQNDREVIPGSPQVPEGNAAAKINGVVKPLVIYNVDDKIRFNLCKATSKNEIKGLRKKLEAELDQVRKVGKQLQEKELQVASYNTQISNSNLSSEGTANIGGYGHPQPQPARSNVGDRRVFLRVNTDVGSMGHQETRPMVLTRVNSDMGTVRNLEPRPYSRQLSVAVMENNQKANEFVEKEKRTPKANQYYRNSEFLLGKDRLPPESNKRLKANNGRKHSGETEHAFGFGGFDKSRNQVFRSCSSLLQRLMKHKHGWVFNEPVDARALGLVDYHDIIKHPMDLGTIKTRLSQNWYKSPREFAEDVRLVFRNAMTYNPKGQDVHVMAEQLSQIFEERWAIIETDYNSYGKYQMYQDGGLPTPTSRKAQSLFAPNPSPVPGFLPVPVHAPAYAAASPQMRAYDRPEPIKTSMAFDPKIQRPHGGRTPVPKKPKAKDPNKRDMTYDEKQRLSQNLQGLPSEKLDAIVQIIKKRNTAVSQNDDEIEVEIDKVDIETLWELDRFVTNYKKSLSKNKRKAELALQARTAANQNVTLENPTPAGEVQVESGTAFEKSTAPTADGEKQAYNGTRSSTSSSDSSDSGSSSSDSDSDSSSADGSDAGHSPRT